MKILIVICLVLLMIAGTTTTVRAQVTAHSLAGAKIVGALTIVNDQKLDFGTMSIPTAALTVTFPTSGIRTTSNPLNIVLITLEQGTHAHFNVTGEAGYHYKITLPSNGDTKIKIGATSDEMSVDNFLARTTSVPGSDGVAGILNSGVDDFSVGATLKLLNAQIPGTYAGSFDVMVTYD